MPSPYLVLEGKPMLDYAHERVRDWDQAVTVNRAARPDHFEIYTATLQKRLPRFRLPLAGADRDLVVDVATVFARVYDQAGYSGRIDYCRDVALPLSEENRRWLEDTLTTKGFWQPLPPHAEIAREAHRFWEEDGRPIGREQEHWHKAVVKLRRCKLNCHKTMAVVRKA